MTDRENKELFTLRIAAGNRNYFFDVKESSNGTKYLEIKESKKTESTFERHRIIVFQEHLSDFAHGLTKSIDFIDDKAKRNKFEEIRKEWAKAYMPWTEEEDQYLKKIYHKDSDIDKLAIEFQRKPSAIRSRLAKLGLIENKV
ncbi:MAG: PUR family DNA/RNA-binding protein [Candidatus Cloacimonetes bacterium]|nr:PUR family DNA/RNA-binding protein [Candidatus Cloacimonadota bacterium]